VIAVAATVHHLVAQPERVSNFILTDTPHRQEGGLGRPSRLCDGRGNRPGAAPDTEVPGHGSWSQRAAAVLQIVEILLEAYANDPEVAAQALSVLMGSAMWIRQCAYKAAERV
jgi:hypothetical protein